jgi:hypothetical protein
VTGDVLADWDGLSEAVAVRVTVLPVGTEAGAVKVVVTPLAVCVGLNDPQLALPQLTVQSTPPLEGSPETVAATDVVVLASMEAGGCRLRIRLIVLVIVTLAVTVLVLSAVAVAAMITLPTALGAVKVVVTPLPV